MTQKRPIIGLTTYERDKQQNYGLPAEYIEAVRRAGGIPVLPPHGETCQDDLLNLLDGVILSGGGDITRSFADGNRLGLGVGIFHRLEKTSYFPLLLIDWKIGDRWRLTNPLSAGPTGPAGLEIDYRLDGDWSLGLGAAWRTTRFRLSEAGPVPNGIGEERGLPVFLRATRNFGTGIALNLYAGVVTASQLRVEDPNGNALREVDADPAPLLGVTFSARF